MSSGWDYPVIAATQNKAGRRAGTPPGVAYDLIGFDGSVDGGLRPFQGFRHYTDLEVGFGGVLGAGGDLKFGDAFPLQFRADQTRYAYGIFYRVVNDAGDKATYHVKFRIGDSTVWEYETDYGFVNGLRESEEDYGGEQMDVKVFGRFVYVGREGLPPFMFYLDEVTPGVFALKVLLELGPGDPPGVVTPAANSADVRLYRDSFGDLQSPHPDMAACLPALTAPAEGSSEARILYWGFSDCQLVANSPNPFQTNPFLFERIHPVGSEQAQAIRGPSDLKMADGTLLWATPPFPDPTFGDAVLYDTSGVAAPPQFDTPAVYGENKGRRYLYDQRDVDGLEPAGVAAIPNFATGTTPIDPTASFVWAYRLYDSRTGRRSALSNRIVSGPGSYGAPAIAYIEAPLSSGGFHNYGLSNITFPMLYIIYDSEVYDTLMLYRGRRVQGLRDDRVILSLDAVTTLADALIDVQPAAPWKVAAVFAQCSDSELASQTTYDGSTVYLRDMPPFGALYLTEGTMLGGSTGVLDPEIGGLGLMRWSSLLEASVELYAPSDRYALQKAGEEIRRFVRLGPNIAGLTQRGNYLFRKETTTFKAFPLHTGFGIVNHRAACELGSEVYFLTPKGIKTLDSQGNLKDLTSLNSLILSDWVGTLHSVSMAYDETMSLIVLQNATYEHMALMWLNTSRLTEVYDCPFSHVIEGDVPYDESVGVSAANPLESRAVFFSRVNHQDDTVRWRAWTIDYARRNTGTRLLGHGATGRLELTADDDGTLIDLGAAITKEMKVEGAYLYILDGPDAGTKAKIKQVVLPTKVRLFTPLPDMPAGTRLGISPVYTRWTGSLVGLQDEQGFSFGRSNFFRLRQITQIGCNYTDVTGEAVDDENRPYDPRFRAQVYRGNLASPVDQSFPIDNAGNNVVSIKEGPSDLYASFDTVGGGPQGAAVYPSVETFCPDVSYTLLGVNVKGSIDATDRERIPPTTRPR